jgi:hypothetical protein
MRRALLALALTSLGLTGCGPGPEKREPPVAPAAAADAPVYSATGTLTSVEGRMINIQHGGVPEAGLAAGTTSFRSYADVVELAPDTPGTKVAFSFQKAGNGYDLTELAAAF